MHDRAHRKDREESRTLLERRPPLLELPPWARDLVATQLPKVSVAKLHQGCLRVRLLLLHVAR